MKKILLPVFLLILTLHCVFILIDMDMARSVTKSLLMPVLILHLWVNGIRKGIHLGAIAGLFFSWLGDLLLLGDGAVFFLSGMVAFVLAHLNYSFFFLRLAPVQPKDRAMVIWPFVGLLLFSTMVFLYLNDYLGTYKVPVLFYMVFIGLMASLAVHTCTQPRFRQQAVTAFIPGALLFVVSDAILAINLFRLHDDFLGLMVMLTYGLAQFFLTRGFQKSFGVSS